MLATETDRLSELQGKIEILQARRLKLEKQKAQLNDTLETIAGRRPALTKAHAKGDPSAAKQLDDLDTEERSIRRSLEGVDGHLASNAAEIQPLDEELLKENQLVAARKQQELFDARCARAWAQFKKEEALESELMAVHTTLHEYLVDLTTNFAQFGGANIATKIYEGMYFHGKRVNAGWRPSASTFGNNPALRILPMLPPKL